MDPKFLVIEIDSKEQAVQLVQVMLDKGFARLMLLDDLAKHPTLKTKPSPTPVRNEVFTEMATSPIPPAPVSPLRDVKEEYPPPVTDPHRKSVRNKREFVNATSLEDEGAVEEEDMPMPMRNSKRGVKRQYEQDTEETDYREQLLSMLRGEPEIVPIEVNSAAEESPSTSIAAPTKSSVGEYHACKLCGVRVKTPRSGRWNLQMHVIALHCVGRQYRCRECDYLDYRKSTMRKHCISQHGGDIPPHNIQDDAMKKEWHEAMQKCFPEFAHRTGFTNN